jgi:ketosteroid isomerase-like protein
MDGTGSDLIRRYYAAFLGGDRDTVDSLLADDFRFSSPDDPGLDKAGFFERCWPNRGHLHDFDLDTVVERGDELFIRYAARTDAGMHFHNMERLRTDGSRILSAEVYYCPPSG